MDADLILQVLRAFNDEGVEYKVVGAVALNLIGLPRATTDLDVFVAPTAANIERLKAALRKVFDDPCIEEIDAGDFLGDYPAIQYVPPEGDFHIDILNRLGEAFAWEDVEVEERRFEGLAVPVATPAMLVRMKSDTVRLQDRADAERIRARYGLGPEE